MRYLIGLDIGTSSVKGVLMRVDGSIGAKAHRPFPYSFPDDRRVELSASDYLSACFAAIKDLTDDADG